MASFDGYEGRKKIQVLGVRVGQTAETRSPRVNLGLNMPSVRTMARAILAAIVEALSEFVRASIPVKVTKDPIYRVS
ncbi:hypothetical protein PpBr36_07999 [Pyricularia pennisetigena]|uniref:hypothetical protein n=1 Tax=Pyricularia pennisetigena TaxID=1578925 RepID=UPI001153DC7B|nr:hypothetical protein PpBr36_07999 [Pyricularia pennisetigena]TLS24172.1 hypothetical protein PpBr36_07999 [Pyricularia pennisetigena]